MFFFYILFKKIWIINLFGTSTKFVVNLVFANTPQNRQAHVCLPKLFIYAYIHLFLEIPQFHPFWKTKSRGKNNSNIKHFALKNIFNSLGLKQHVSLYCGSNEKY